MAETSLESGLLRFWKLYGFFGYHFSHCRISKSQSNGNIFSYAHVNDMACEHRVSNILESKSAKKNSVKIVYIRTRGALEIRSTKLRLSQPLDKIQ